MEKVAGVVGRSWGYDHHRSTRVAIRFTPAKQIPVELAVALEPSFLPFSGIPSFVFASSVLIVFRFFLSCPSFLLLLLIYVFMLAVLLFHHSLCVCLFLRVIGSFTGAFLACLLSVRMAFFMSIVLFMSFFLSLFIWFFVRFLVLSLYNHFVLYFSCLM